MAKDKERSINPAQAQRKADKAKALKKSKASLTTQRNEKLARRNPERLQRQIDDLKAEQEANSGNLRPRDKQQLEQLEKDVRAIRKARDASGYVPEKRNSHETRSGRVDSSLGKRRRDDRIAAGSDTDEEVRQIPMPRDTPPPIPRQTPRRLPSINANETHLGENRLPHKLAPAQTTYAAAPQIRDLRKEATAKFVPAAVSRQIKQTKGQGPRGQLLEPEEADRLERAGYYDAIMAAEEAGEEARHEIWAESNGVGFVAGDIDEEETKFRNEMDSLVATDRAEVNLKTTALKDRKMAVQAEVEDVEHGMMAEEVCAGQEQRMGAEKTERRLRYAEIEEVEDEDR